MDKNKIKIIRFAGIVQDGDLAKYLKIRESFIRETYARYPVSPRDFILGMEIDQAKLILINGCPWVEFANARRIHLWVDMVHYLKPEASQHIRKSVTTMAAFQEWLHHKKPHREIFKLLMMGTENCKSVK